VSQRAPVGGETVRVEKLADGGVWRVVLSAPIANLLDERMILELTGVFEEAEGARDLKALLIEGEGPNFSFGASVEEHLPGKVERVLPRFHRMFRALFDCQVFCVAVVRGRCLGGGLELASFCQRVVAAPGAVLGQPEIVLGVFAPVASVMLVQRIGRARAEELCITGRPVGAAEALAWGLVDEIADDPRDAALSWVEKHLVPKSGSSLRYAVWAIREPLRRNVEEELDRVEKIYLEGLMATSDAGEGLRAFLEKREPRWRNA
jgi:cyclohexa-1,5-dienecarbonyl-CoA hydratase